MDHTDHFRILGIGLGLACNGGSSGKLDYCHLYLKGLRALASLESLFQFNTENTDENGLLYSTIKKVDHHES